MDPIGTPAEASFENPTISSFLGGYSTGDVLVSFLMATVFFEAITRKSYTNEQFVKVS